MKKNPLLLSFLSIVLIFTSCKKEKNSPDISNHPEIPAHADDQSQFSDELDLSFNEIAAALEANAGFSGRYQNLQSIACDAEVVYNSSANPKTITITYSGAACIPSHTRTGTITISMPQTMQWKNAGATITVNFQNVKITRTRDNKSVTINGTQTYTNQTGGLLINLPTVNNIIHRITATDLSVAIDNGTPALWNVKKQRLFTYNNGIVISTTGFHVEGGNSSIAIWGTNRYNRTFITTIKQPLVFRQSCDFRITAGEVEHRTNAFVCTVKFGLDVNGNATACPGAGGTFYFKATWFGAHQVLYTAILPY